MAFISTLKSMDNKFAWSFLGFLMAIIFGAFTLYLGFYKEVKPDLNYVITADSSVLDVKENLGNLDVIYKNQSLNERQEDLRFITFNVVNQGNVSILSNYYDKNDPVGFEIVDGELADDPVLLGASNDYLKEKLLTRIGKNNKVFFSSVILEPGEYFEIKVLVLHKIGNKPSINSFGKVAGVNSIDVLRDFSSVNKPTFIEITFGGGLFSNLVRLVTFGSIFLFMMIVTVVASDKIESIKEKKRKERILNTFKEYDSDKVTDKDSFFFDYYLNYSARVVWEFYSLMMSEEKLAFIYQDRHVEEKGFKGIKRRSLIDESLMFEELKNEGFITIKKGVVLVDEQRLAVLTDFINYLRRKGELKRHGSLRPLTTFELHEGKSVDGTIRPDA